MSSARSLSAIFLVAASSTVFCTAINAYTYRIAYPLWRAVGKAEFPALHRQYLRCLTPVITLPHIVMFFSTALLLWRRPAWFSVAAAWWLFALTAAVVAISALAAGPIHDRFTRERTLDPVALARLLRISALRTALMCAASIILALALLKQLSH